MGSCTTQLLFFIFLNNKKHKAQLGSINCFVQCVYFFCIDLLKTARCTVWWLNQSDHKCTQNWCKFIEAVFFCLFCFLQLQQECLLRKESVMTGCRNTDTHTRRRKRKVPRKEGRKVGRMEGHEEGSKEGSKEGRLRVESLTLWNLIPCNFTSSFYPLVLRVNRSSLVAIRVWFPFWILAKQEVQKEAGKPRRIENIP